MASLGEGSFVAASQWLASVATGSIATGAATIAVAAIGFAMLAGRVDLRRGATVILGCFILFAAPSLASAFVQWANGGDAAVQQAALAPPLPATPAPPPYQPHDPYAGASLIR
ncbi:TrbC/VirB2 family protein [Sphingopyxis sp. OPL5]|uniref:TrbC/VirB2 family protein n=1 Tax=Sphingopyxis sp. OPL5 TaxID=2486273 RepID=UPI00164DC9EF|nr:TrbC/VirB2 family protein [Sphingopyxis sp. OPL5]QNO27998.1 TrbC/VirB2 family protein [Sphingopyxis sp. OPL5]